MTRPKRIQFYLEKIYHLGMRTGQFQGATKNQNQNKTNIQQYADEVTYKMKFNRSSLICHSRIDCSYQLQ